MKFNGAGARRLDSWIDSFVKSTEVLETPRIFRRWAAISCISGVLEQKVSMQTATELFPNIYCILAGAPGIGKTKTIEAATAYLREIPDFHVAPTSLTSASLVDALVESKRMLVRLPDPPLEYNSMFVAADEMGAFIHHEDRQIFDILAAFYSPTPYGQDRRGKETRIRLKRPQISILAGSTPSVLLKLLPDAAWEQGFCSRLMLIHSDERIMGDDAFVATANPFDEELMTDLRIMNGLHGVFEASQDFKDAVNSWRREEGGPSHPKLAHYRTRRMAHLLKLAMVSAIDRSNALLLTLHDFKRSLDWMLEAELAMGEIFKVGSITQDSKAMDEIKHFVGITDKGRGVTESRILNFARERVPSHTIRNIIDIMVKANLLTVRDYDERSGNRTFIVGRED